MPVVPEHILIEPEPEPIEPIVNEPDKDMLEDELDDLDVLNNRFPRDILMLRPTMKDLMTMRTSRSTESG